MFGFPKTRLKAREPAPVPRLSAGLSLLPVQDASSKATAITARMKELPIFFTDLFPKVKIFRYIKGSKFRLLYLTNHVKKKLSCLKDQPIPADRSIKNKCAPATLLGYITYRIIIW